MKKRIIVVAAVMVLIIALSAVLIGCKDKGGKNRLTVQYVADNEAAKTLVLGDAPKCDFALVSEPMASKLQYQKNIQPYSDPHKDMHKKCEMDIQAEYTKLTQKANYPQAGLFVKEELAADETFMTDLFAALGDAKEWIYGDTPENVKEAAKHVLTEDHLMASPTFPTHTIQRYVDKDIIDCSKISDVGKDEVITFLGIVMPEDSHGNKIDWNADKDKLFKVGDDVAYTEPEVSFTVPQGTPALTVLKAITQYAEKEKSDGEPKDFPKGYYERSGEGTEESPYIYKPAEKDWDVEKEYYGLKFDATKISDKINYKTVQPGLIAAEMSTGKSDIVIMPVNAGAKLIHNGAKYKLVSIAVNGNLYIEGDPGRDALITFDDLKGRKIACIGKEGTPGLIFRYVMEKNGIEVVEG